jgi:spermidine synthase
MVRLSSTQSRTFLISFAALFFEVLVIRWVSSEILIFGYFKNLILMGAFLGLGLGCSTGNSSSKSGETSIASWFPFLFAALVALIVYAPAFGLTGINFLVTTDIFFWLNQQDIATSVDQLFGNALKVIGIFSLIVCCFDALGRVLGRELAQHPPLSAYAINLGGSLAGVLVYAALAFLQTPPAVWLIVGFCSVLPFYKKWTQLAVMAACIAMAFSSVGISRWSPYYRVDPIPYMSDITGKKPYRLGTNLMVNHSSYQRTINLSEAFVKEHPELKQSPEYFSYNLAYRIKPDANNVLILGAGSGNDAAAALRNGIKHVDAVEIDPVIMSVGKNEHPEHPYSDERVTVIINDARNYIEQTKSKYDLIIFGFVDSSVSFSMLSSVRLDNFLYTAESLKRATELLSSDGIASLSFAAGPPWLRARLFQMVEAVSQQPPLALGNTMSNKNSITVLWGPGLTPNRRAEIERLYPNTAIPREKLLMPLALCTDDWPFLYQKERAITFAYGVMLALLLVLAGTMTVSRFRLHPKNFLKFTQFFFLGAGFLLLETRAVLSVAVLFGSTWFVNSIVISLILLMALISNWIVQRYSDIKMSVGYIGLAVGLAVLYLVPLQTFSGYPLPLRLLGAVVVVGLPFVFSGVVFSTAFAKTTEADKALGINILGALLGGCLEYFSIVIGTKELVLLAFVLYLASFFASRRSGGLA